MESSIKVFVAKAAAFDRYGQIFLVRSDGAVCWGCLCCAGTATDSGSDLKNHCLVCAEELLPVPVQSLAAGQPYPHKATCRLRLGGAEG